MFFGRSLTNKGKGKGIRVHYVDSKAESKGAGAESKGANEDGNEGVEANSSTEAGAHDGEEKFDPK